jgi:queuine tRNA-ribosyltransferase
VTLDIVEETVARLPEDKPRYLMGVGAPEDIVEEVALGIDIFDCALPTQLARRGALYTWQGRRNIKKAAYARTDAPFDSECDCYTCRNFSAAYLHHLFRSQELLALRLATIHNLRFMVNLVDRVREAIINDAFSAFKDDFLASYQPTDDEVRLAEKKRWLSARGHQVGNGEDN